jgi:hypothetical protein
MKAVKVAQEQKAGPEGVQEGTVGMGEAGKASTMKDVGSTSSRWGQRQAAEARGEQGDRTCIQPMAAPTVIHDRIWKRGVKDCLTQGKECQLR